MVAPIPDDKKREAIRLRVEERLCLEAIAKRIGVSKGKTCDEKYLEAWHLLGI